MLNINEKELVLLKKYFMAINVGFCECCGTVNKLYLHHWYEECNGKTKYFAKKICPSCNSILITKDGKKNHILPSWENQKMFVKKFSGEWYRSRGCSSSSSDLLPILEYLSSIFDKIFYPTSEYYKYDPRCSFLKEEKT